jgi:5-formyltetrahydrofolate cyclo-ligase
MEGTKAAIRQAMGARRRALAAADLRAAELAVAARVQALPGYAGAPALLAYVATDGEVPTGALLTAVLAAGKRLYLPRLVDEVMTFAEHRLGATLRPGAFGIPEPTGDACAAGELVEAMAVLPLLAWDDAGGRVGRGGGHYDRTFAGAHRPRWLIGLGHTFQQVPHVPSDPWDLRLDGVVTEHAAVTCWAGGAAPPPREEGSESHGNTLVGAQPGAGGRAGVRLRRFSAPAG